MRVIKTDDFLKQLSGLPTQIRRSFTKQEELFLANVRDSRLHLKKLTAKEEIFSLRLTRHYRCLFYFHADDMVVFFAVGHRKDIYR